MKKLSILMAIFLIGVLAVACGGGGDEGTAVKTGLGVVTTIDRSTDASADEDGMAEAYSMIAAVLVDADGKITACKIDAIQTATKFDTKGMITTDLAETFMTKNELGEGYGMKDASGIGKEWNEQAAFFADYVVGKTLEEVQGIAMDETGLATDEEVLAGVTVHISPLIDAIALAVNNAADLGAMDGDTLGLGVSSNIARSTDATADAEGVAEAYTFYAAATTDADGKITSAVLDASQAQVKFDTSGAIKTDLATTFDTKDVLGDGYGMKDASGIGMEWYQQAANFAEYAKGKTIDEVKGVAMDEEGVPTDEELTSQVTIHVGDFLTVLEKATAM